MRAPFCLQAVLQAAYLRQVLQTPLAATTSGTISSSNGRGGGVGGAVETRIEGSGGAAPRSSAEEDCCESCRSVDRQAALRDSRRHVASTWRAAGSVAFACGPFLLLWSLL